MSNPVEAEGADIKCSNEGTDNDLQAQVLNLVNKVAELEKEKKDIHDNFNAQRAKLQKLFLQNEEKLNNVTSEQVRLEAEVQRLTKELDEAKSQLFIALIKEDEVEAEKRKAQAEIATLNQIVQGDTETQCVYNSCTGCEIDSYEMRDIENNDVQLLTFFSSHGVVPCCVKCPKCQSVLKHRKVQNDTVEVSSTSQSEVKTLKQIIQLLESQLNKLRGEKEKEGLLLAPSNMLSGAKTLARRVVGQLGNESEYRLQDNLEDSMKKAQEDTKVLRSLVIPLEEKIQELTSRLQTAEQRLTKYEPDYVSYSDCAHAEKSKPTSEMSRNASQDSANCSPKKSTADDSDSLIKFDSGCGQQPPTVSSVSPTGTTGTTCNMCANYETQLVSQQKLVTELQKEKETLEKNVDKLKDGLIKETKFRKTMEDKWNEKKEEHKTKVAELKALYEGVENELKTLRKTFVEVKQDVKKQLAQLSFDREKVHSQMEEIQRENENLMGKHAKHSEQLREESINFPDNVEELQVLLLKTHEDLIAAKVAEEAKEEQATNLQCEIQLLREQLDTELSKRSAKESDLTLENSELSKSLIAMTKEKERLESLLERLSVSDREQKEEVKALRLQVADLMKENRRCEEEVSKLQSRVGSLQQQLDTSEVVQKDFVRLSQSLQIELEKIRRAETEVRWQHEDDVDECSGCKLGFSGGRKKDHCRHCGQIFCPSCLSHVVSSGPRRRPSRVCQVCHTLLNREIAPYFSQEPPHTPD